MGIVFKLPAIVLMLLTAGVLLEALYFLSRDHGDKDKKHFSTGVRTKHLTEREVVVTGFTPTTATGRPFGAICVSEWVNGKLVERGNVGTGYTVEEMLEIHKRFKMGPLAIIVRSQGLTENGILWLGRFDSIV